MRGTLVGGGSDIRIGHGSHTSSRRLVFQGSNWCFNMTSRGCHMTSRGSYVIFSLLLW